MPTIISTDPPVQDHGGDDNVVARRLHGQVEEVGLSDALMARLKVDGLHVEPRRVEEEGVDRAHLYTPQGEWTGELPARTHLALSPAGRVAC